MDRDVMKKEAVKRMKLLGIMPSVIEEFDAGVLEVSEYIHEMFPTVLYWASNYEGLESKIKEFEEKHDALVYHVQFTPMEFGRCFSFLYVSEDEEEWEMDRENIKNGESFAYVWNADDDWCSEFGYIGIRSAMGGVMRTD